MQSQSRNLVAVGADFLAGIFLLGRASRLDVVDLDEPGSGLLFENVLAVEGGHAFVLGLLLQFLVAGADLFFARGFGDPRLIEILLFPD